MNIEKVIWNYNGFREHLSFSDEKMAKAFSSVLEDIQEEKELELDYDSEGAATLKDVESVLESFFIEDEKKASEIKNKFLFEYYANSETKVAS